MSHSTEPLDVTQSSSTSGEAKVIEVSHLWTIKNFSFHSKDPVIVSAPFFSEAGDGIAWHLSLHPEGRKGLEPGEYVSLYLENDFGDRSDIRVKYKLSMLGKKSKVLQSGGTDHPASLKSRVGFARFIKRAYMLERRSTYFPEDELKVLCEITYAIDGDVDGMPANERHSAKAVQADLLEELFRSRSQPNIVFVVEGKEFPVHKAVLSLRSPILKDLFARDCCETTRLEIHDIEQTDFEEMLRIIYTGETMEVDEMTNDLIAAMMSSLMKKTSTTEDLAGVPTMDPVEASPDGSVHRIPQNAEASKSRDTDRMCELLPAQKELGAGFGENLSGSPCDHSPLPWRKPRKVLTRLSHDPATETQVGMPAAYQDWVNAYRYCQQKQQDGTVLVTDVPQASSRRERRATTASQGSSSFAVVPEPQLRAQSNARNRETSTASLFVVRERSDYSRTAGGSDSKTERNPDLSKKHP